MRFLDSLLKKQLVGLDIGISGIKAVEISSEKSPRLLAYNRIPLNWDTISIEGEIKDRNALVQALKKLFSVGNFSSKNVSVSAFGRSIISKRISVPMMTEEELDEQLYWEAEQYIPFNTDEVNLDFAILGPNTQTLAPKKDFVNSLKSLVKEAGLNPVIVDTQAFALGNSFEFNYHSWLKEQGCTTAVLIDFGAGSTKISVIEGHQTTFSRDIQHCGTQCTEIIMEKFGVNLEDAERLKIEKASDPSIRPLLIEYSHLISDEISKSIDFFLSQANDRSVDAIFTCGGGVNLLGLNEVLKEKMPAPVYLLNPLKHIVGTGHQVNQIAIQEIAYLGAVATGLSLRKSGDH